jgi:hypothetical protein
MLRATARIATARCIESSSHVDPAEVPMTYPDDLRVRAAARGMRLRAFGETYALTCSCNPSSCMSADLAGVTA